MKLALLLVTFQILLPLAFSQSRPSMSIRIFPDNTCRNSITTYSFDNDPHMCQSLPSTTGGVVRGWPGLVRCERGQMLLSYCTRVNDTSCGECIAPVQVSLRSFGVSSGCVWDGVVGAHVAAVCPPDYTIIVDEASFIIAWIGFCLFFVLFIVFMALFIRQKRKKLFMSTVEAIPAAGTTQLHKTVSARIREQTLRNYDLYSKTNNLSTMRIADLHKEMSVDRMAGLITSSFGLFCFTLTILSSRWWMVLLFASLASLVQQGVTKWSLAYHLLRILGFRTHQEIFSEIEALRIARGDFDTKDPAKLAEKNIQTAEA